LCSETRPNAKPENVSHHFMKHYTLTIILTFLTFLAFADEQRLTTVFKSENGKFTLKYNRKKWNLIDENGKKIYSFKDAGFTSMTILISNDGKKITVIDDFIEGHKIGQRKVLYFYNSGNLISNYRLVDLLSDTCSVVKSVWHTIWTLDDFKMTKSDSVFSIATFNFFEMEFDTQTGQLIRKARPQQFDETNTLIVIGKFYKSKSESSNLTIQKYIYGPKQPNDSIAFITNSYGQGTWKQALMIKNGIDITPQRFRNKMLGIGCE